MAYQDFLLDKRIVQRHIDKGIVDAKVVDKSIKELPDRTDNVTSTALEDDLLDDEDEDEDEAGED
jgi:hypothetical protein